VSSRFLTELERRRGTDALRTWEPHRPQREFVEATEKEVFFAAANRVGKTNALGALIASRARWGTMNPLEGRAGVPDVTRPANIWAVSLTTAMSRKLLQPLLFDNGEQPGTVPFIPASEIKDFREKPEPTLYGKDGWVITFKSCEQGGLKFQGSAIDLAAFDEAPPYPIYKETAIRVGKHQRALIRMACTLLPPAGMTGGVIQWLYSEKIQPWKEGKHRDFVRIVGAAMRDNPHLPEEAILDALRTYPPGSLDRRVRVDGEWLPGLAGNRVYQPFERVLHINPTLTRDSIDPHKPILLTMDANVAPLCAAVVQKHGSIYRILDEIVIEREASMGKLAAAFVQRYPGHRAELHIYGDAMANRANVQTSRTDYELFMAGLGNRPHRLCVPVKNPPERDRVNVVNYLLGADGRDVRVEIAPHCTWVVTDFEQVLWRTDGSGIRKSRDPQDPYYQRTHISDAIGYLLFALEPGCVYTERGMRRHTIAIPSPVYGFSGGR